MDNQGYKIFAIDILLAISAVNGEQSCLSLQNEQLFINKTRNRVSCATWPDAMQEARAHYFLEKMGLMSADLAILGMTWRQALQQDLVTGLQLKELGLKTLSTPTFADDILGQWRKMIEARLMPHIPDMDYVENLTPAISQYTEEPLALFPMLHAWPERLIHHPDWSCAEPPLPEIPPLPLDEVWVDLYITEPSEENDLADGLFSQAVERRYRESQWVNMPADFVLESLKGTMVLVGAPGIGKTTLMKWVARRLIQNPDGRFLLPLFVPLRAYALAKAQQDNLDILSFSLGFCGVQKGCQIEKWSTILSYLSGTGRNTVLFLLDGWDEVPQDMREGLIAEIKRLGHGFSIIITSRPSAYPKALGADQFFEISDLPPENISKLVLRWHQLMSQPQQADVLLKHLRKHPDLLRLARNPFLLNLLCAINMKGGLNRRVLPRNRTELYTHTLSHIYHYQTNKYPASPFNRLHISQTQSLALWLLTEAPNHPQYLFGSQEVEQVTRNKDLLPQVLSPSRLLSQWHIDRESLHFLHTSFQEYLAAEALLKLDGQKRIALITQELHNPAWQEILCFIAGKNIEKGHDFWHIIQQLANNPDQCGLITIRLSQLIAETGLNDGGRSLLGYDLREQLWVHIKTGIATDYFVQAYVQLDVRDYINHVNNTGEIRSSRLKARLIRSLGKISSRESSQALLNRLTSKNLADAAVASYAVKDVLDAEGIQQLRSAIRDKTRSIDSQKILVRALGNCEDYASIPFLVSLHHEVPELRKETLNALGGIGGLECSQELAKFLQLAGNLQEKQAIVNALGRAFDLSARDVLISTVASISPDDPLLEDILEALCEIPIARHSELISIYLDSYFSEAIRVQAIWALMEATEVHITDKLVDLGERDSSEKVRIAALAALKKRARSFDFSWLSKRVRNESCDTVERANALEAIFGLYHRSKQGQLSLHEHSSLHSQVLLLTKFSLNQSATDINLTAVTGAYILGVEIAPVLLEVCENEAVFSGAVRESACISLGKIKYQTALPLFIRWIEKVPELLDDEEEPLTDIDSRLARVAAQAYVQTDLISAANHKSQTARIAVSKFALEQGYLIFSDRIIAPNGKILDMQAQDLQEEWKLNPSISAFEQQNKLRFICQYLLDEKQACLTSKYANKKPPPLFKKSPHELAYGIEIKTGKKLLDGDSISYQAAEMLMKRLKIHFKFVFSE